MQDSIQQERKSNLCTIHHQFLGVLNGVRWSRQVKNHKFEGLQRTPKEVESCQSLWSQPAFKEKDSYPERISAGASALAPWQTNSGHTHSDRREPNSKAVRSWASPEFLPPFRRWWLGARWACLLAGRMRQSAGAPSASWCHATQSQCPSQFTNRVGKLRGNIRRPLPHPV